MKIRNNVFSILLFLLLSLSLLTACQAKVPSAPAADLAEAADETKAKEQPVEIQKKAEEAAPQEQPSEDALKAAPAETPAEPQKKESSKSDDKACFQIEGTGIEKSILLSLDEMKAMNDAYFEDDFFSLNSYGTKKYFHFKGIKIKAILDKAELKDNAKNIKFVATDGYTQELTIDQALREDYIDEQDPSKKYPVIIAWHEDGKDYDAEKGPPFRLVIGQEEPDDMNKVKWVMNITKIIVN